MQRFHYCGAHYCCFVLGFFFGRYGNDSGSSRTKLKNSNSKM